MTKPKNVDWQDIYDGHMVGGSAVRPTNDLFPAGFSESDVRKFVLEAWKSRYKSGSEQVLVVNGLKTVRQGYLGRDSQNRLIQMYYNATTKTLETAFPQAGLEYSELV